MALPSAFQERLRQMEETRHQRISLLQAEKELQTKKSDLLSTKLCNILIMEQRCLMLEHQNAGLSFKILSHKTEIEQIETRYNEFSQEFRVLKREVEEVEESENGKDKFYEMKICEMEKFKARVENRVSELRQQVLDTRKNIDEGACLRMLWLHLKRLASDLGIEAKFVENASKLEKDSMMKMLQWLLLKGVSQS